jgi:3-oxoacyl-[acyl-carrier protein] reductase
MHRHLERKTAIIYGAGGAIGGAVSRAFAAEGARVFLAGPDLSAVHVVAREIIEAGGLAETAQVDALDESAIEGHAANVARKTGAIDISFNVIGIPYVQGKPLVEQRVDDFVMSVMQHARTQFLTATTAARYMIARRRSGAILMMTAPPDRMGRPLVGAFGPACAAIEAFARTLAAETGPHGVRVVCLRSSGSQGETDGCNSGRCAKAAGISDEQAQTRLKEGATLRRLTTLDEVARVAVFVASDDARATTGTFVNVASGLAVD